jgi:hypothetical protein
VSLWYLGTHEAIAKPVQAGLALAEISQIHILQLVLETLSQEQRQTVVAGGIKTRSEWEHGLQVRKRMLTDWAYPFPLHQASRTPDKMEMPEARLEGGREGSTSNGVLGDSIQDVLTRRPGC